jgi:hypothetical protein
LITEEVTGGKYQKTEDKPTAKLNAVAAKQVQIEAEKQYGSPKRNARNVSMQNTESTPSLTIRPTTIGEGDEGPNSDTPIEDIPFWARGHRNHSKKRSSNPFD